MLVVILTLPVPEAKRRNQSIAYADNAIALPYKSQKAVQETTGCFPSVEFA